MARSAWALGVVIGGVLAGCGGTDKASNASGGAGGSSGVGDSAAGGGGSGAPGGSAARGGNSAAAAGGTAGSAGSAGANGSTGTCPFTACGGNVVGSWKAVTTCQDPGSGMVCPGQSVTTTPTSDLIVTFAADGSVSLSSLTETIELDMPEACAQMLGRSADQYCAMIESQSGTAETGVEVSADCKVKDGVCHCEILETIDAASSTYVIAGNELTLASDPAVEYCVTGDTLTLRQGDASSGAPVLTYTRVPD